MAATDPAPVTTTLVPETATATLVSAAAPLLPIALPAAEAGTTTSEYGLVKMFGIVSGAAFALLTGAVGAKLIAMTPDALAFVGSAVAIVNGAVISVYAAARSSRKKGTPG